MKIKNIAQVLLLSLIAMNATASGVQFPEGHYACNRGGGNYNNYNVDFDLQSIDGNLAITQISYICSESDWCERWGGTKFPTELPFERIYPVPNTEIDFRIFSLVDKVGTHYGIYINFNTRTGIILIETSYYRKGSHPDTLGGFSCKVSTP